MSQFTSSSSKGEQIVMDFIKLEKRLQTSYSRAWATSDKILYEYSLSNTGQENAINTRHLTDAMYY